MQRTLSIRGRYFIAALAFGLISLLLALFVPLTYSETKYFELDVAYWYIPFLNYVLFAVALSCIIVLLITLGIARNAATYIIATLLAVSALAIGYMSFLSLTTIDDEKMFVQHVFDKQTYYWEHMTSIELFYSDTDSSEHYVFTFDDGSIVHMPMTQQLYEAKSFIYSTANTHRILYTEQPFQ